MIQRCAQTMNTRVDDQAADQRDRVVGRARRRRRHLVRLRGRTALHRDAVGDGPGEEAAEQQHVGEHAVGEQVRQRPELDGEQERVLRGRADPARQVGGEQQRKDRQHDDEGEVAQPGGRRVEDDRIAARHAVADDDQRQAHGGSERVEPLPGPLAEACDRRRAPSGRDDRDAVDAQEDHQADDEHEHGRIVAWNAGRGGLVAATRSAAPRTMPRPGACAA